MEDLVICNLLKNKIWGEGGEARALGYDYLASNILVVMCNMLE